MFFPEVWQEFAKASGIQELTLTTQDEPDYNKLMEYHLEILRKHEVSIFDIQKVVYAMQPFDGARDFLDELLQ